MEIFVQDLYHFAREIITAHDCKTFDTGAQILTSVQRLKQVFYTPIMQMDPSQFDQLMQLNPVHSTSALSFLVAQFHQQTLDQFTTPVQRERFTDCWLWLRSSPSAHKWETTILSTVSLHARRQSSL
mmetsp:Transcript_3516/g.8732  ORF Transcript_3516/g.8732 Transcript_3516/m.8732 type:complete len:127 (+) Transcript_3516:700-1080(+)